MKLRKARIGVRHEHCWGSLSTLNYPDISLKEKGPIRVEKCEKVVKLSATWDVTFKDREQFKDYLNSLNKYDSIQSIKVISISDDHALLNTEWISKDSSYDLILKNNCLYISPVTQENGYEIYDIIVDNHQKISEIMDKLSKIGGAKIFHISRVTEDDYPFTLTGKQFRALQIAVTHNFYAWPRKVSLDEIASMVGMKRRTFQENLRRAEAKVFPNLINNLFDKQSL